MLAYLQEYFSVTKKPVNRAGCWRVRDGLSWCPGHREDITDLVISIPVIFAVEVLKAEEDEPEKDSDNKPNTPIWKFPPSITPLSEAAAQDHNIIYDLVGYVVLTSNDTHFTAKYISKSGSNRMVYTYDGMQNNGCPVKVDLDHLNSDVKAGDWIHEAIYYLRGGVQAQDMFVKLRSEELKKKYPLDVTNTDLASGISITYTAPDLKPMDPKQRSWMTDPYRSHTAEYISITEPWETASPTKGPIESEDEEPAEVKMDVDQKPPIIQSDISAPASQVESEDRNEPTSMPMDIDNTPPITHLSPPAKSDSEVSAPNSAFSVDCRCGQSYDGNLGYDKDNVGEPIQCDFCKDWSHIACQKDGRASNLGEEDIFLCDACNISAHPAMRRYVDIECRLTTGQSDDVFRVRHLKEPKMKNRPLKERLMYVTLCLAFCTTLLNVIL
jgi:hypothetical protein